MQHGDAVAPVTELVPGTDVGGYRVEGVLGAGGMGVVYAATHSLIGKRAAIKVLRPELSTDQRAVDRFITEARSVNQIGHPNIVDIFAFGELPDGRSYYMMDLLVGESLRTRLRRTGALHLSEAATVVDEIASALIAAHGKGIIHRDLKPDNIFLAAVPGKWPEVKLLDWGLAKLASPTSKFRTVTGALLGTPLYMSPEQARAADTVDARTDIYSLGVVAYELLVGTAPFKRETSVETLMAHAEEPVPPLAPRVPAAPDELVQLVEAMLAKDREARPTLAAIHTVLRRLKGSKIPTMTAAGLSMDIPITTAPAPADDSDELRTVNDSELRTRPPPRSRPLLDMDAMATFSGPTLAGTPGAKASQAIPAWQQGSVSVRPPLPPPPSTAIREAPPVAQLAPSPAAAPSLVPPRTASGGSRLLVIFVAIALAIAAGVAAYAHFVGF